MTDHRSMSRPASVEPGWLRTTRILLIGTILAFIVVIYVPWNPDSLADGLDPSFRYALNELYGRGAQFGTEVIYQYGPFGFLLRDDFHPETYLQLLAARLFFAVVLAALTLSLAIRSLPSIPAWWLWSFAFAGVLTWLDMPYMLLPHLALLTHAYGEGRRRVVLLGLATPAMALASLIKFTFLVMNCGILGLAFLGELLRFWANRSKNSAARWRELLGFLLWPAGYGFSLVLFWLLADQGLGNLRSFVQEGLHLASTYGVCHSLAGPRWELVGFVIIGGSFVLLIAYSEIKRRGGAGIPLTLALAFFFFMSGKHAFVRHDPPHAVIGAFYGICVVWLYGLVVVSADWRNANKGRGNRKLRAFGRPLATLGVAIAMLGYASVLLATYQWPAADLGTYFRQRVSSLRPQLASARKLLEDPRWFASTQQKAMAQLRQRYPLPPLEGAVDLYPFNLNILFAHGFRYQQRPLLQSFQACDSWLAEKNAEAIAWPQGPDHILFEIWPIDYHLPATEDSLSWPHLLAGYQPRQKSGEILVLDRAMQPAKVERRPLGTLETGFNTWRSLEPPVDGLLWIEIEMERSLAGSVTALLFREPQLYATVQLAGGDEREYRLFPRIGHAGFLLSPIVDSVDEFARLYAGDPAAELRSKQVEAFKIRLEKTWAYQPKIELRLFDLVIDRALQ